MKSRPISDYTFSENEIKQLTEYRDLQEDYRLQRRFIVFLQVIEGVSLDTICKTFKISPKTVDNWFKQYSSKGIDALNTFSYVKKKRFYKRNRSKFS
ncbi:MAG: helix-turn-helix domain-containing protein [Proteobacteria bacterium]|nr:helix-turn-helix domain-containing protein [Pseudomonadota bacterium]